MWFIFLKELRELRRDKKTLFFMIALPLLLFPLGIGAMIYFTGKVHNNAQYEPLTFGVTNEWRAPVLLAEFNKDDGFKVVFIGLDKNPTELVETGEVDFVINIPDDYSRDIATNGQIDIELLYSNAQHNAIHRRVAKVLSDFSTALREENLSNLGVPSSNHNAFVEPFNLKVTDLSDKRVSWGERIGGLIPYFIFILCLQGAMLPASDLGAGEKERGTLETLIICPVDRYHLVAGKFLTIAFAGVTAALISVASIAFWGVIFTSGMAVDVVSEFMGRISALDFTLMFLMLVPVVSIFASALLSLSIYARSFKEAQSYMGPMMFFAIVPIIVATMPGVTLDGFWSWVPLTNVALAIKELIKGTMNYFALMGIFISTMSIAAACIVFSINWFGKEKILYR